MVKDGKIVIFDLDGTLALIDKRRAISTKDNGKMDWDTFFDPKNIDLDQPNTPVIKMAQMLKSQGFDIVIFSGRSDVTKQATLDWLDKNDVPFDFIQMRDNANHFLKDSKLKKIWLDRFFPNKDDIFAVFDDRNQVVDMWRDNGLQTFQVAEGDF